MIRYVKHGTDGSIVEQGYCQPSVFDGMSNAIEVDSQISADTHYVDNGKIVEYTEEEARRKANRPPHYSRWNNVLKQWEDARTAAHVLTEVRARRNALLRESDWTVLPDSAVTGAVRAQWVAYRQELRNITTQPDPSNIVWPTPPAA